MRAPSTTPPISVAEVTDHQREEIAALCRSYRLGPLRAYEHHGFDQAAADTGRRLLGLVDDPEATVLVATLDGAVVGVLACAPSPWESEHLQVPVGRLTEAVTSPGHRRRPEIAEELYRAAGRCWAERGGGLLIARIDVGDGPALVGAQDAGLRVLETRITYLADHDAAPVDHHVRRGFEVRRHVGTEITDVPAPSLDVLRRWIAATERPGHFYSDPRLSRGQVDALYISWLERTFSGAWADIVYTAWADGEIVGFLAWLRAEPLAEHHGIETLVAGLGAAASPEGRGALGDMYATVCADRPLGTRFVEHTSQAGNAAVLTVWSRFERIRPGSAQYVLHGWFGG